MVSESDGGLDRSMRACRRRIREGLMEVEVGGTREGLTA